MGLDKRVDLRQAGMVLLISLVFLLLLSLVGLSSMQGAVSQQKIAGSFWHRNQSLQSAESGLGEPVFAGGGFRAGTVHVCATDQAQSLFQVVLAPSGRISLRSDKTEQALCRGYAATLGLRAASEPAAPWAWRK